MRFFGATLYNIWVDESKIQTHTQLESTRLLSTGVIVGQNHSSVLGAYITLKFGLGLDFYRAMHYIAKRGLQMSSVCPSVCVCLSIHLDHDNIG